MHPQAAFTKSMYTPVSWSRWGSILVLLGSFGSIWVGDHAPGRKFKFWVLQVKKFKFESMEKWGMNIEIGLYLSLYKYLVKEAFLYWWNIAVVWGFERYIAFEFWFLKIFECFRWGQRWGGKVIFDGKFKNEYWAIPSVNICIFMWNNVKKFYFMVAIGMSVCKWWCPLVV